MLIEELIADNKHWLVILTIPGVIFLALFIAHIKLREFRKKLEPLADALGGEVTNKFLQDAYLRLHHEGVEMRVGLISGSKNSPPYLTLKQMTSFGFGLTISEENIATRKLGSWGILKDIKIGDPVFDDKYLIRSSDAMRTQNFLLDHGRRQAIEDFFNKGFTIIAADKEWFVARKPHYKDEDLEPDRIRSGLELLRKITSI